MAPGVWTPARGARLGQERRKWKHRAALGPEGGPVPFAGLLRRAGKAEVPWCVSLMALCVSLVALCVSLVARCVSLVCALGALM